MSSITEEIVWKYTHGDATLEETNAALKEAGSSLYFDPYHNVITPEEMAQTTVGERPEDANGYGYLDTGTGTLDKIHIVHGKTEYPLNTVDEDGVCHVTELVYIMGKTYRVIVDKLVERE